VSQAGEHARLRHRKDTCAAWLNREAYSGLSRNVCSQHNFCTAKANRCRVADHDAAILDREGAPVKTTLLIEDANTRAKLMLQNPSQAKEFVRETDFVAGSNCDRWGHPYGSCVTDRILIKAARPFSLPLDE
jgi:hypothetical protein